jgi:small ligand-binding sensory domain FIST
MEWNSVISNNPDLSTALASCVETLEISSDEEPNVIFVFASPHYGDDEWRIGSVLRERYPEVNVVGCTGGGIIGGGYEVERRPALSVTAASMPGTSVTPFHLESTDMVPPDSSTTGWMSRLGVKEAPVAVVLFADPFSADVRSLVVGLEAAFPSTVIVGGLASGGREPGEHTLQMNGQTMQSGVVGVCLSGNIAVDTIVAQGCRPIGPPCFVTSVEDRTLKGLDGRPALDVLEGICRTLEPTEAALARQALFAGVAMRKNQQAYESGDFLVRELVGAVPDERALVIAAQLTVHDILQFHIRDARAAWAELDRLLERFVEGERAPVGALMFSCVGRGEALFGEAGHDSKVIAQHLGKLPIGGFFGNGELGPVGGQTWIHGYTTVLAFFRTAGDA